MGKLPLDYLSETKTEAVWADKRLILTVPNDLVEKWSKNGTLLADFDYGSNRYNISNLTSEYGINVEMPADDSNLIFTNVNRSHSDFYLAKGELVMYGLNMTVHGKVHLLCSWMLFCLFQKRRYPRFHSP